MVQILICAAGLAALAPSASYAEKSSCAGLERFLQLSLLANDLLSNPAASPNTATLTGLLALANNAEVATLRARLNARFRSLEYNDLKSTLADLRRATNIGLNAGRGELRRYALEHNLAIRTRAMRDTIRDMCTPPGETRHQEDTNPKLSSFSGLITNALKRQNLAQSSAQPRSHSSLFLVYVGLGALILTMALVPYLTSQVYALLLRRARCQIPATIVAHGDEYAGHAVCLSLRGLNFKLAPLDRTAFVENAQLGAVYALLIGDMKVAAKVSYFPDEKVSSVGLRLLSDLDPKQHRTLLALSTVPPTREPRRQAKYEFG